MNLKCSRLNALLMIALLTGVLSNTKAQNVFEINGKLYETGIIERNYTVQYKIEKDSVLFEVIDSIDVTYFSNDESVYLKTVFSKGKEVEKTETRINNVYEYFSAGKFYESRFYEIENDGVKRSIHKYLVNDSVVTDSFVTRLQEIKTENGKMVITRTSKVDRDGKEVTEKVLEEYIDSLQSVIKTIEKNGRGDTLSFYCSPQYCKPPKAPVVKRFFRLVGQSAFDVFYYAYNKRNSGWWIVSIDRTGSAFYLTLQDSVGLSENDLIAFSMRNVTGKHMERFGFFPRHSKVNYDKRKYRNSIFDISYAHSRNIVYDIVVHKIGSKEIINKIPHRENWKIATVNTKEIRDPKIVKLRILQYNYPIGY